MDGGWWEWEKRGGGLRMPRLMLQLRAVQGPFALIPHSFSSLNSPLSTLPSLPHPFISPLPLPLSPLPLPLSLPYIFLSFLFFFFIQTLGCAKPVWSLRAVHRSVLLSVCSLSVYYIPWSVVYLRIVKLWLSAAAPELWVRREQGCKLLAINREQGGFLLEKPNLVINQSVSRSYRDPPFWKKNRQG